MNYISETLNNYLDKLPKPVLKNLLLEALDVMSEYNGHSISQAIYIAMDAVKRDDGSWRLPSVNSTREKFS